jgi:hypothetical protein
MPVPDFQFSVFAFAVFLSALSQIFQKKCNQKIAVIQAFVHGRQQLIHKIAQP